MKSRMFIAILLIIIMISGTSNAQDITISDTSSDTTVTTTTETEQNTQVTENTDDSANLSNESKNEISEILKVDTPFGYSVVPSREQFEVLNDLAIKSMTDWEYFYRNYYSRNTQIKKSIFKGEIGVEQKAQILEGFLKIYDYIAANGRQTNYDEYKQYQDKFDEKSYTKDFHFSIGINYNDLGPHNSAVTDSQGYNQYAHTKITLWDNYCEIDLDYSKLSAEKWYVNGQYSFFNDYYYIENPKEFMDFVLSMGDIFGIQVSDGIEYKYGMSFDYEKQTAADKPYTVIDRVSFEADIDNSFYDTFIEQIASPDSTISGVIELIGMGDGGSSVLLNLKGDRGERLYAMWPDYSWESNSIMFYTNGYLYDNHLVSTNEPMFHIRVEGKTDKEGKINLTLTVNLGQIGDLPTKIVSKNLSYESFIDENTSIWDKNRNLGGLFSLTREKMKELSEKIEEQMSKEIDYENSVDYLRVKDEDGNIIHDYYVHFIAQVELSVKSNILPDWYNKLGDNVTATVVGITRKLRTLTQVDSMILFKGDKGEKWFTNSSVMPSMAMTMGKYDSDEELSVKCTYSELKSFDGEKTVRNSIDYEQMSFEFKYKNDGYLTPDGIEFKIGAKSQYFDEDDIKYIGGGKFSYANLQ